MSYKGECSIDFVLSERHVVLNVDSYVVIIDHSCESLTVCVSFPTVQCGSLWTVLTVCRATQSVDRSMALPPVQAR